MHDYLFFLFPHMNLIRGKKYWKCLLSVVDKDTSALTRPSNNTLLHKDLSGSFAVRAKNGRFLPILFPLAVVSWADMLICRSSAGTEASATVFGAPSFRPRYRGQLHKKRSFCH